MPTTEWLTKLNQKLAERGVPPRQRPWIALREWAKESGVSVGIGDPDANRIFAWFDANSKPGSHGIGPLFTGCFYYDVTIWPVNIPVMFGSVKLYLEQSIELVPTPIRQRMLSEQHNVESLSKLWFDCLDYAYGYDGLCKSARIAPLALDLLRAGDKELRSSVTLLLETNPTQKVLETASLAAEMFLKAFLVARGYMELREVRAARHDLNILLEQLRRREPEAAILAALPEPEVFPPVKTRYTPQRYSLEQLWHGYRVAQALGVAFTRSFSDRASSQSHP